MMKNLKNRLFVGFKPAGLSSSAYLNTLKKKYKVQKAGYSGTLDPFAKGVLIIAFNQYTRLFRFLKKAPKVYEATLWLGVKSLSGDDKNIIEIKNVPKFDIKELESVKNSLLGHLNLLPPQFSAKKINGKRAYEMAKKGEFVELKKCLMNVFSCEIRHYFHPFLTLKLSVSEGSYIRSYASEFGKKLGINISLSNLERLSEGKFIYNDEKSLNVLEYLKIKPNFIKDLSKLENGTKLALNDLEFKDDGKYFIEDESYFSIICVKDGKVNYLLNKVLKC